ncbi:hypothetical protein PCANC_13180 [Puccinia coronata f. sp. avenae]|uniref:Uncharacterized protein n=1 Tax=Puccinia coronata f. sp. avenae TaxID=200324 RepID=A0A2N5UVA5_9BASI|nr:hypothetical protein PCANC_13180 [Puccinia coronata f. sp. avenae]
MFGGRNGSQVVPRSRAEQRHQTTEADVTIPTALGSLEHRHKSVSTSRQSIQAKSTLVIHPCLKLQETPRMVDLPSFLAVASRAASGTLALSSQPSLTFFL